MNKPLASVASLTKVGPSAFARLFNNMQRYTFEVHHEPNDTYPNNFKCWVVVCDHAAQPRNKVFRRRGYGKYIGNFSPIWISIGGQCKQLTEWERETCPPYTLGQAVSRNESGETLPMTIFAILAFFAMLWLMWCCQ